MRSAGSVQLTAVSRDAEQDDATTFAGKPRRQLDCRDCARRLDHDVEQAADEPPRLGLGVMFGDVHNRVGSERPREIELLLAKPEGDDRGGRVEPRDANRERAQRADSDDADGLAGLDPRSFECFQDARARLDEARGLERHVVGQCDGRSARERPRTHPNLRHA